MVGFLKYLPPFGANQGLPEYDILELMEFALPPELQKQLLVQGYEYSAKGLYKLLKLCERLETTEDIYKYQI